MTDSLALLQLLEATKKTTSSSVLPLLILVGIAIVGYFFFLRPQQRKAQAARSNVGKGYEVGDDVQTIGGVVGTILEIHGDRFTLLTGATGVDGNLDGAQPTRIVFVRQAIARKVDRIIEADPDIEPDDETHEHDHDHGQEHPGYGLSRGDHDHGVDDDGPTGSGTGSESGVAGDHGDHDEEAEEA